MKRLLAKWCKKPSKTGANALSANRKRGPIRNGGQWLAGVLVGWAATCLSTNASAFPEAAKELQELQNLLQADEVDASRVEQAILDAVEKGKADKRARELKLQGELDRQPPAEPGSSQLPASLKRCDGDDVAPNPEELEIQPDGLGRYGLRFRTQPWTAVLRWYAASSNRTLSWGDMPSGSIELETNRPYAVDEIGDMLNRALLVRGYTMLEDPANVVVVQVEDLRTADVPRVEPQDLYHMPPHRMVRTSFKLTWLLAEDVYQEYAQLLSQHGQLVPLVATNRLEAMDTAGNLNAIYQLLEPLQRRFATASGEVTFYEAENDTPISSVYQVQNHSASALVKNLHDLELLSANASLDSISNNRVRLVTRQATDHQILQTLLRKFGDDQRRLFSVQLRRHRAAELAKDLEKLFRPACGPPLENGKPPTDAQAAALPGFGHQPDNTLTMWLTENEWLEIRSLLARCGELTQPSPAPPK